METTKGLEAKMIATKVDGKNYGEKVMENRWYVVHSASGRAISPVSYDTKDQAETQIGQIYAAIPEADWTKAITELVRIPNLQTRIIKA